MSFEIDVDASGLEKISQRFQYVDIQINSTLTNNELLLIAERTIELARDRIPFKTGAARDSLQIQFDGDSRTVRIGSDGGIGPDGVRRTYLRYLELGTSRMTARPFLLPSVLQALNEFKERYPLKIKELARVSV